MSEVRLAIIGGTGVYEMETLTEVPMFGRSISPIHWDAIS